MTDLLVTGGAGFIGSNFVAYWLDAHPEDRVVVLDALTYAGNRANLEACEGNSNFTFVEGDICDFDTVGRLLTEHGIDTIVHFAAETHVDRSIDAPDAFIQTNVVGTHTLLRAAKVAWLDQGQPHRFHHVSTDEVYGALGPDDPPFTEATAYAPNSPYAASKAASDHLVRAYHRTYGLAVTTSNCSNNYGPYQFPEKLIPSTIVNLLLGRPVPVYGAGEQIRDWLHVDDHCRALDLVLSAGRVGETYNIGGEAEWRNIDLVHAICDALDRLFEERSDLARAYPLCPPARGIPSRQAIRFVEDRPGHDFRYALQAGKLARELGFETSHAVEGGIAATLLWYVDNQDWWQGIHARIHDEDDGG